MTQDLLALGDWLHAAGCTHVAMASTGAYWRPVYNVLEGQFTLLVGNALHRSKETYLAVQYRRLATRRGKQRALVALGHAILVMV